MGEGTIYIKINNYRFEERYQKVQYVLDLKWGDKNRVREEGERVMWRSESKGVCTIREGGKLQETYDKGNERTRR